MAGAMRSLRLRQESRRLRDLGDSLQGDVLFQAGLFALLLGAFGVGCITCYFAFWRPLLSELIRP